MNFILGYLLLTGFYLIGGQSIIAGMNEYKGIENSQQVKITEVEKNSPAEKNGIQVGDIIKKVNGIDTFYSTVVSSEVQSAKNNNEKVVVTLKRGDVELEKTIETYTDKIVVDDKEVEVERVGIVMENTGKIRSKWYLAPVIAAQELVRLAGLSVSGLFDFFGTLVTSFKISENVGGPIAIYQLTGAAAELGFSALVQITIMLTIVLGVFNILPFPALDGGHILFLGIEKVRGKSISQNTKNIVNLIGFGLLLLLIIVITWGDLGRLGIMDGLKGIFK
jgi:regulator of sigma E protease